MADATRSYADVVKTRLQTEAKTGQTNYKGMGDAFVKICGLLCSIVLSVVIDVGASG